MSTSVEQKIVQMVFDTTKFGSKIQETLNDLAKLQAGLKLEGASKGLQDVSSAADRFSLGGMKNEVNGMSAHFTALQVAAVTALSNIVNRAVDAGLQLAKSLTLEPVMAGFHEYETNLNSIQTILANTGLKGAEGLAKVTSKLDELNHYADQTIYNFSEMAKNIGTFTAAGVDLDVATAAIKGIANLAAISGSNAEQASAAMYQLSQALAAGKVTLEDWNSVVNAGMGGKVFQDSLIETARVHGVQVDAIIKKQGSFRSSLEKGWLTSEILTETLSKFTGELSEQQLTSMGYTAEQAKGIMEMGQTAVDAATKVKTITQLIDTLREAVGSGWAKTWQILFGDFDEAKVLFTNVSNVLGKMIGDASDARNELLQGWKDLGGRAVLIEGIGHAFEALLALLRPVKEAFQQVFPAATAEQLFQMTQAFSRLMEKLIIGGETANNIKRTFAGFFAVLGIGWDILKAGIGFVGDLISRFAGGSGGILRFTANIGDMLVALRQALQDGNAFGRIFDFVLRGVDKLISGLRTLKTIIFDAFAKVDITPLGNAIGNAFKSLTADIHPMEAFGNAVAKVWSVIQVAVLTGTDKLINAGKKLGEFFHEIKDFIAQATIALPSFSSILQGLEVGGIAGIIVLLKSFLNNFSLFGNKGGFLDTFKSLIEGFTGSLKGMQNSLNGAALLAIGLAILTLANAFDILSKIDAEGLARAGVAVGVIMGQLLGAFVIFAKLGGGPIASAKVALMATSLIRLGAAVRLLVSSVEALAKIPLGGLTKGLVGVIVLMAALVGAVNLLPKKTEGMVGTATGLLVLAIAIRLLVVSVEEFAVMDWEGIAKGLIGVGTLLGALALFTKFAQTDKMGISSGLGIILLATAMKILASAVGDFAAFNWEELGKGAAGIGVGLGLIVAAINLLPEGAVVKAAGVLIVAASLQLIADAVKNMAQMQWMEIARGMTVMAGALAAIALSIAFLPPDALMSAAAIFVVAASLGLIQDALGKMGGMSWEEIGKGLVTLAGSLLLIGAATYFMEGALPGAAAIAVVAVALTLMVPVLQALGNMSIAQIVTALIALAAVFVVLGAAGYILGPLAPAIVALAGSIALLGAAVFLAGVGVLAFALGLTILSTAGAGAVIVFTAIVTQMIELIPLVMQKIAEGLVIFAHTIATSGPQITEAMTTVLLALLDSIIKITPKVGETLTKLLETGLQVLVNYIPKMVEAGEQIIIGLLDGITAHIDEIVTKATDFIVKFIETLTENQLRIVQAGVDMIISVVNGVADGIRNNGAAIGEAGVNLATALIEGIIRGIGAGVQKAVDSAVKVAQDMFNAAKAALGIKSPSRKFAWIGEQTMSGLAIGTAVNGYQAVDATTMVGDNMINAMSKTLSGLSKVLGSDLIDFEPTITPVLDLSGVKKSAEGLTDILSMQIIDVSQARTDALRASSAYESTRKIEKIPGEEIPGKSTTFIQNNNSPKALSNEEIYRQSKNLISQKGANA